LKIGSSNKSSNSFSSSLIFKPDYLANYEGYNLLKKIEQSGIDNIKIVEAINSKSIIENYKTYKELNKEFNDIEELEDLSSNLSYKLEDTEYILELYNKYKDDYPFIFKMNNLLNSSREA
jgi:protein subunit release factor A